jgi:hypothetical protein
MVTLYFTVFGKREIKFKYQKNHLPDGFFDMLIFSLLVAEQSLRFISTP